MYYLKTLFFNFFAVYFANHILPGIDVVSQTKLPNIGGDLMFAVALGFLNSLIYPILKLIHQCSIAKILILSFVINFVAYATLQILPIGIHVTSLIGYFMAAGLVSLASFLTNFLEMKHKKNQCLHTPPQGTEFHQTFK